MPSKCRFLPLVLIAVFATGTDVLADTETDGGIWGVLTATGSAAPVSPKLEKFRWWLEGQVRFQDNGGEFNQGFVRPGLGYEIVPRLTVWAGYGWFRTSPESGNDFDEHRIWQQLSWSTRLDPVTISSRTRLEQRFVETGDDTGWRFRQRIALTHSPWGPVDLVVNDEVFLHMNSTDWGADSGFDQNRGFAGLGWNAHRHVRFEVGYLNQFIARSGRDDAVNHILVINLQLRH